MALATLALVAGPCSSDAETTTANLRIEATIVSSCSVVGNTLDFGEVSEDGGTLLRTKTKIDVTCTQGLPFQVGIDNGSNDRNGQRRMKNRTSREFLRYEIYKSQIGNDRFGDSIVSQRVNGIGRGQRAVVIPAFGEIQAGQSEPAGRYLDNAVVTVYF